VVSVKHKYLKIDDKEANLLTTVATALFEDISLKFIIADGS
jgi:hypothetical protein